MAQSKKKGKKLTSDGGLFDNVNLISQEDNGSVVHGDNSDVNNVSELGNELLTNVDNLNNNIENNVDKSAEDKESVYYLALSKGQIYSFLRKGYISSGIESLENNSIKKENFIDNCCLRLFKKDNLPVIKDEILVKLELNLNNIYITRDENGKIFGLVGFLPLTTVLGFIFKDISQKEDFENPVPNMNDNFVIPHELCYVDESIYAKCTNQFAKSFGGSDDVENITKSIEKYTRLLGGFFFANYNTYLNDNSDSYGDQYIKFLQDMYGELSKIVEDPQSSTYNSMFNLAYSGKLSYVENLDDFCNLLLNGHIINISDYSYIKSSYKTTIGGLSNFEEFFEYKNNSIDNVTWQIISFLVGFCNNKSLEERSINLSNTLRGSNIIINPRVTFILGMCCTFSNIVCEISGNSDELSTKKKMKELFSPIRKKILDDMYNFVVGDTSIKIWPESEELDSISTTEQDGVLSKKNFKLMGEEYSITRKFTFKEAYLIKIKKIYGKNFENIKKGTYIMSLLLKNNNANIPENNLEALLTNYLETVSSKNEELEQVLELDQKYS